MSFDKQLQLTPEVIDLIIGHVDAKTETSTLKTVSIANSHLRTIAQRHLFANVDIPYNVEFKIQSENKSDTLLSLVDGFLQLLQTSPHIAIHVRGISFLWDTKNTTFKLDAAKGLAAAHSVLLLTKNLKRISFPVTNYYMPKEDYPAWQDLPQNLRETFLDFYRMPSSGSDRTFDIQAMRDFPAHLLLTLCNISELSTMTLNVEETANDSPDSTAPSQEPLRIKCLKMHQHSDDISWLHWKDTTSFLKTHRGSKLDLRELSDLQVDCSIDDAPNVSSEAHFYVTLFGGNLGREDFIPPLLSSCAPTLKNLTLRIDDRTSFYTTKHWKSNKVFEKQEIKNSIDLSKLSALESLTVHFSVDHGFDIDDRDPADFYRTHAPWVGNILKTLIKSPAYTTTLSSITFAIFLGKWCIYDRDTFPMEYELSLVDWSEITKPLSTKKARDSSLKVIKFKFLAYTHETICVPLKESELEDAYKSKQLKKLQEQWGIVVVE